MIKLFRIETFKLFKRTKTWVVIAAFILLAGLITYGLYRDSENMKRYSSPENKVAEMENYMRHLEEQRNSIPEDIKNDEARLEEFKRVNEQEIENAKIEIARLKSMIGQSSKGDWREALSERIKNLEEQQKSMIKGSGAQEDYIQQELDQLRYMQKHDIKPMDHYDFNAINFLTKLIQMLGEIFLAIGIAVFAADMVSGEATPPTMKLLLTQPVSRAKVLFSKFLSINLSSVVCIIGVELIAFVLVGAFFGFGDVNYPMFVGAQYKFDTTQLMQNGTYPLILIEGTKNMIPAWQYLVRLLLLQALFITVCTSVVFLISTLVKASMVSMGISVVSAIAAMIVFMGFGVLRSVARFIYVLFGDVESLLTGQMALRFNNPNVNLSSTLIVFVAWIVLSYAFAHLVFTKKDILI